MKFIPASEGRCFTPAGHDKTVTSRLIYKNAVDIHGDDISAGAGMAEEVHADFTHLFFVLSGQMEVIQGGQDPQNASGGGCCADPGGRAATKSAIYPQKK